MIFAEFNIHSQAFKSAPPPPPPHLLLALGLDPPRVFKDRLLLHHRLNMLKPSFSLTKQKRYYLEDLQFGKRSSKDKSY